MVADNFSGRPLHPLHVFVTDRQVGEVFNGFQKAFGVFHVNNYTGGSRCVKYISAKYYGLSASPPIFIPFVGAVINLRQRPQNAKVEGIVGIAGPVAGTIGALVCFALFLQTGAIFLGIAAYAGFLMNLFNLLPVPPLDGGRVTAAVSPWIWMLGLVGLALLFIWDWQHGHTSYILLLVLIYAFPRIKATLQGRERFSEYYNITRLASWSIGTVYVLLGVILIILFMQTGAMLNM